MPMLPGKQGTVEDKIYLCSGAFLMVRPNSLPLVDLIVVARKQYHAPSFNLKIASQLY